MQYSEVTTAWRPWPLSRPFLLIFTILCAIVIISLELLLRHTRLLSFPAIPYAPTIISVLLGLIWATAVHDYKRLEPYFQMSHPAGAPAKSTLLLDYSYMFPLFVPFFSAKNRHTAVLLSSTSLLLISLALTPALSSIFDDTTTTLTDSRDVITGVISQDKELSSEFAYLAYSRAWLSGHLPGFTTDKYALAPFVAGAVNETWRGRTTLFEAELRCLPGIPTPLVIEGVGPVGVTLTAGDTVVEYVVRDLYFGYDAEEQDAVDAVLGGYFDRPESDPVSFIVGGWTSMAVHAGTSLVYIWGPRSDFTEMGIQMGFKEGGGTNWTAVVCEPGYSEQGVVATVNMASGEVVNVQREGNRTVIDTPQTREFTGSVHTGQVGSVLAPTANLTDLAKMNVTFGRITAQFPSVDSQMKRRFGETFETPKDTESPLLLYNPNTRGLTAFAMYTRENGSLAGLLDPGQLGRTYETAFKLMYANVVTVEFIDEGITTDGAVERTFRATGWTVNKKWARATQVGFGLLMGITVWLAVITWGRRPNLQDDPGNLAAAMKLLSRSPGVRKRLENTEYYDPEVISKILKKSKGRYLLSLVPEKGPQVDLIDEGDEGSGLLLPSPERGGPFLAESDWILTRKAGLGFFVFFFVIFCLLVFLFVYDRSHNGLPTLLPPSSFGYKVLFSYFPTLLATAIEPLIASLGAYHCMVGPYKLLRRQISGPLPLLIDFEKSPPLFQFLRAVTARDILLIMLTVGILLGNILAVSFAALFSLEDQTRIVSVEVVAQGLPNIVGKFTEPAAEAYYELAASISGEVPQANWTTSEFYVLPFNTTTPHLTLSGPTVGLGAEISCSLVPDDQLITLCLYLGVEYPGCIDIAPYIPGHPEDGNLVSWVGVNHTCWHIGHVGRPRQYYFQWRGPTGDFFQRGCADSFFVGWAELPADPHPKADFFPFSHLSRIDAVVLYCTAGVRGAALTAEVDKITSTSNPSPLDLTSIGNTSALVDSFLTTIETGISTLWSTVDLSHEIAWFGTLMTTLYPSLPITGGTNSTHLPHTDRLAQAFEDVYRRLFAVSLRENADVLFTDGEQMSAVGESKQLTQRVRVNTEMWVLSTLIVGYFLVLVVAVYWRREEEGVAPPTTLAKGWALVYASGKPDEGVTGYTLGGFVGEDGRKHWGVHSREKSTESEDCV